MSFVCNAASRPINHRRNPEFSTYNKHGTSRSGRNRKTEDSDDYENLGESDTLSSKPPKAQPNVTPGHREKKIVELFRKVQAQLRARAAATAKEERKVEVSRKVSDGKESEAVDSLVKLLRKHSIQEEEKTIDSADFIQEEEKTIDSADFIQEEEKTIDSSDKGKDVIESKIISMLDKQESEATVLDRPKSNFRKRSPLSRVKIQSSYSFGEDSLDAIAPAYADEESNKLSSDEDASSEIHNGNIQEEEEEQEEEEQEKEEEVDTDKLHEMTVLELRGLAKSRGLKGYSKLKKVELIEMLGKN
ncbi:unnamed protein product [Cuscuta campestris]|uniref:Rho termination factor-like N-terminal domain-containing protein n=1 Tax=Cuscuta campestris TaxID=132261 RepID=A0A484NLA1_9ASTE|nr:unnamed protein product [Cuscuta campestris]